MNMQLIQDIGKKFMKKVPVLKPGATVRVHQRIKEGGKERVQVFEGLIIKVNAGNGPNKTFTVRKIVGGIGVEKIFPVYSKNITKIQVTKASDVRRSKLYYMRKRSGKSARLREKHLTEKDVLMEEIEGVGEESAAEITTAPEDNAPEAAEQTEQSEEAAPTKEDDSKAEEAAPAEEPQTEEGGDAEPEKAPEEEKPAADDAEATEEKPEPEAEEAEKEEEK